MPPRHAGCSTSTKRVNWFKTDFVGKTGNLTLIVEKDKNKKFPDKNAVADVVKAARFDNLFFAPEVVTFELSLS